MTLSKLKSIIIILLLAIIAVMTYASLKENMFNLPPSVTGNIWFQASLWDVYTGLFIFYLWVLYKVTHISQRIIWLVLLIVLGNIATALFVLIELLKLPKEATITDLLLNKKANSSS